MAATCLPREAMTETLEDTKGWLKRTVADFHQRHGGDWDELESEANLAFVKAWYAYDQKKARFTTWMRARIWFALLSLERDNMKRKQRTVTSDDLTEVLEPERSTFELGDLMSRLRPDARRVLQIVLTDCRDFTMIVQESGPVRARSMLKRLLKQQGWEPEWIEDALAEIFRSLK